MNNTNGAGDAVLTYKKVAFSKEIVPDLPEGEWQATILRGKSVIKATQAGDPMIVLNLRLDTAEDEANESYQGSQQTVYLVFYSDADARGVRANKFAKPRLLALASQAGVDLDVVPEEINTPADLQPLVDALEGQTVTVWTTHRNDKRTPGLKAVNIEFVKPGQYRGAATTERSDD